MTILEILQARWQWVLVHRRGPCRIRMILGDLVVCTNTHGRSIHARPDDLKYVQNEGILSGVPRKAVFAKRPRQRLDTGRTDAAPDNFVFTPSFYAVTK